MEAIQQNQIRPMSDSVKWLASAMLIIGGLLVSASARISSKPDVFALFLIGHIIWIAVATNKNDRSLLALNVAMAAMDAYAIWVRM